MRGGSVPDDWSGIFEGSGLGSTAVVSLDRHGLGATTGFTLFCVAGDASVRAALLGVEGDGLVL